MSERTLVIVWTGYRAGPWAARSLRSAGWRLVAMHPADEGRGRSTACLFPRRCPSVSDAERAFVAAVADTCRRAGARAVLPVGEECVRVLAASAPWLGGARIVGPDAAQYAALCDKRALAATAARLGVGHPRGVLVTREGADGDWPPLPSFVKTRDGVAPDGGRSALRVDTVRERDRAVRALLDAGADAVVEELLTGSQWTVHGVRSAEGGFAAVAARMVRTYPRGAGPATVCVVDGPGHPAIDATRRLLEGVGYVGPANAQFFLRDGALVVHDVNLRLPASVALAIRSGLDLPALGVAAALGGALPEQHPAAGLRYVSLGDELRAMWRGGDGPSSREVALDVVRGALSRRAMLDPPLRDPLWIGSDLVAGARRSARRALSRARA